MANSSHFTADPTDGSNTMSGLSVGKKACFAGMTCIVLLSLIEISARAFSTGSEVQRRFSQIEQVLIHLGSDPGEIMFEADVDRFWRLKPSLKLPANGDKRWSGFIANSNGYRNREFALAKPAGTYRVVCIGDSTTFGFGVDRHEAWPHQMEVLLNGRHKSGLRIDVVNAGVPGYTSYQGLRYIQQILPELQPDLVIATFGNNDGWSWDDHTDREFATRERNSSGLSVLNSSRAIQLGTLWYRDRFGRQQRPDHRWADDAWSYRTAPDWKPRVPVDEFAENLSEIALLCRRSGADVALVQWPDRIQLTGTRSLRQPYLDAVATVCGESAVMRADVVRPFLERSTETRHMYLPDDNIHVNADGNRIVAEVIADVVRRALGSSRRLGN